MKIFKIKRNKNGKYYLNVDSILDKQFEKYKTKKDYMLIFKNGLKLDNKRKEVSYVLALDKNKKPIGLFEDGNGIKNKVNVQLKDIATFLLLIGAESFITIHNHPANILKDSVEDHNTQQVVMLLANLLGINYMGEYIYTKYGCKRVDSDYIIRL